MSGDSSRSNGLWWGVSWVVISASVSLILMAARPTAPTQPTSLSYPMAEADEVMAADRSRVKKKLSEDAQRALTLAENRNLAQLGRMPPGWEDAQERAELRTLGGKLSKEPEELRALQAHAAGSALDALLGRVKVEQAETSLGGSIEKLRQYKLASGPHLRAPAFVIRTFYKARLNQMLGLSPTAQFSTAEQLAHFGWPAFHALDTSPVQRLAMLDRYQSMEKDSEQRRRAQSLRGQLLWKAGAAQKAAAVYEHLYEVDANLRYRNHALFMYERAKAASTHP